MQILGFLGAHASVSVRMSREPLSITSASVPVHNALGAVITGSHCVSLLVTLQDPVYDWLGAQEERQIELDTRARQEESGRGGLTSEDTADEQGAPKRARIGAKDVLQKEGPNAQGQAGSAAASNVSIREGFRVDYT